MRQVIAGSRLNHHTHRSRSMPVCCGPGPNDHDGKLPCGSNRGSFCSRVTGSRLIPHPAHGISPGASSSALRSIRRSSFIWSTRQLLSRTAFCRRCEPLGTRSAPPMRRGGGERAERQPYSPRRCRSGSVPCKRYTGCTRGRDCPGRRSRRAASRRCARCDERAGLLLAKEAVLAPIPGPHPHELSGRASVAESRLPTETGPPGFRMEMKSSVLMYASYSARSDSVRCPSFAFSASSSSELGPLGRPAGPGAAWRSPHRGNGSRGRA